MLFCLAAAILRTSRQSRFSHRRLADACWILLLALLCMVCEVHAQELLLESWRKDDQIFWEEQIIPVFEQRHPNIRVRFRSEDPLYYDQKLDARLVGRTAGDLIYCRPFDGSLKLYQRGQLQALSEDLLAPFSAQARQAWSTEDGQTTFCLPVAMVTHGFFYNQDIFERLGLSIPQTMDDLLSLLARLQQAGVQPLAMGTADMWETTQILFSGWGPQLWKGERGRQGLMNGQLRFTDPPFVATWQWLSRLKPYLPKDHALIGNSEAQMLFGGGQAAVFPTGSWDLAYLRQTRFSHLKQSPRFGVFQFPPLSPSDPCQVTAHPDFGIGLNPDSDNVEAAKTFLAWLASAEFAQLLSDVMGGFFPLAQHPIDIKDPLGHQMLGWTKKCATTPRLNAQKLNRVWPTLEDELWFVNVKVLDQRMTPNEAATRIQRLHEQNPHVPHPR